MTILGAQYYRPPNPPREDWRRDLERMSEAGLNTVKLWACWSWVNGVEGEFDLADLEELVAYAGEIGLDVVINTIIENAPYWLEDYAPFARYRDHEDRPIQLTAAMNTPGGGWPGLCFDNDEVRDAAGDFLSALVQRFDGSATLTMWDVWNEPHLEPASYYPERIYCYCDASLRRFREWLVAKYVDIGRLNEAWSRRYSDWGQVKPPRVFEAVPDMLDWREFWIENLRSWLEWRVNTVRGAGATKPVMTHVALSGFTGQLATHSLDEFTLTDSVDAFGTSSFPTWLMADDHVEHLFNLDTARDAAREKPFWQAELQGGRGRRDGLASTGQPAAEVVSLWMWNSLAAGATGVMFWQWRPELLGPESPGYGLCAPDGSITDRVKAVTRFSEVASLSQLGERTVAQSNVALLVSRKAALHAFATDRTMALYRDAVMGAYRLLTDQDVAVTILHEDNIERAGVPAQIRSIYWPMPAVASDALVERLARYVSAGGRLVTETGPGEYTESGHRRPQVPAGELRRVFGLSQHETTRPADEEHIDFGGRRVSIAWQVESAVLEGADVVGTFADGSAAITTHPYGDGVGIQIASYPSLAYHARAETDSAESVVELLDAGNFGTSIRWEPQLPGLVTRRAHTKNGHELVFAINWTSEPAQLRNVEYASVIASTAHPLPAPRDAVPARSAVLLVVAG